MLMNDDDDDDDDDDDLTSSRGGGGVVCSFLTIGNYEGGKRNRRGKNGPKHKSR